MSLSRWSRARNETTGYERAGKGGNPATQHEVVPYLQTHTGNRFVTSSLVVFEFFRLAKRRGNSQQVRTWLGRVLNSIESFDENAGLQAAQIEASLQQHNETLRMRDLLIASHAKALGATFVTYDKNDFESQPVQQLLDVDIISS